MLLTKMHFSRIFKCESDPWNYVVFLIGHDGTRLAI